MKKSVMSKTVTIGMPAIVGTILALVAGALQVAIVGGVVHIPLEWREMCTVLLVFFAGVGINPLVGHAFYAALKLSPGLANLVSAALAAAATATTTLSLSPLDQSIILGVITVAAGLGFQPVSPVAQAGAVVPPPPREIRVIPVVKAPVSQEAEGQSQGVVQ